MPAILAAALTAGATCAVAVSIALAIGDRPVGAMVALFAGGLAGGLALVAAARSYRTELRSLDRERDRLAHALERRDELLSIAHHQLRSHLTGVAAGLETARARTGEPALAATGLLVAERAAVRLERTIDTFLPADHGAAMHLEPQLAPVDVAALVRGYVRDLGGGPAGDLVLSLPAESLVTTDAVFVEQILDTLVSNALHHGTPPVELSLDVAGACIELVVRDHGFGLPVELADAPFAPFRRGHGSDGHGLGTFIAARLATALGGTVGYEAARPGARFTVCIPVDGAT